mgnify:CR=1 FL=1
MIDPALSQHDRGSLLAELLLTMGEAVVTVDAHGTIVLFNRAAEHLFGYAAEDVLGQPLGVLLPEASRATHAEHMRRFAQSGDGRQMMEGRPEIQGLRRDGSTFLAAAAVTKTWQGGSIFYTAVLRDVTLDVAPARRSRNATGCSRHWPRRRRISSPACR